MEGLYIEDIHNIVKEEEEGKEIPSIRTFLAGGLQAVRAVSQSEANGP